MFLSLGDELTALVVHSKWVWQKRGGLRNSDEPFGLQSFPPGALADPLTALCWGSWQVYYCFALCFRGRLTQMFNSVEDIGQCFIHFSYHCCCFLLAELFVSSAIPQTVACQAPLSMGFPRQEHWSRLPFSSPGHFPNHGIKPTSPTPQANSLPLSHQGSSFMSLQWFNSKEDTREGKRQGCLLETGPSVWSVSEFILFSFKYFHVSR